MKSSKYVSVLVKTIACALMLGSLQAHADGGYTSEVVARNISTPNFWVKTDFTIPSYATFPSNAKFYNVIWKYTINGKIPSKGTFAAVLCHGDDNTCIDVTRIQSGTTTAFNTDGKSVSTPFYLKYRINSPSSFSAVATGSAQLIVNMSY
ncbi:flagellar protein FlhE [Brenneria goodwinii]|uniref:flagellar protein FlhE n=1 Tax=Brenneria goodwinii TaxID=1109412 RepID=UPI000907FD1A|nr:flagellar protein FlhE [Brenneria goodwinii]MCG8157260.1 flagellar protein FlhE [Brenneria goodwinii]MCG8162214.1 flagellar protein FlhE [Brenneria goodwinii]MCG8166144.1 flagellar protein FlhE [Brenneria goodwinii]MCG8170771.1 flagellar protein FlhE [Brenneria goodwinii]MCG8175840.1 flagellar protein FlhE [Brenneria goodwinii]